MKTNHIITLMLLISFGSVCAAICAPVLPLIQQNFHISQNRAENCISYYLIGYAVGQLIYGPLVNYYGSRKSIIIGILIGVFGSALCILSSYLNYFDLLLIGRIIMALGAGSGLTLAFAICGKLAKPEKSARIISILSMSFAIMPGIGVFIGGFLGEISWDMPFYLAIIYGIIILCIAIRLPETISVRNNSAIHPKHILKNYLNQLRNRDTVLGGFMAGGTTTIVYSFVALAPFIAQSSVMHLSPQQYGQYNIIPVLGMIIGSIISNQFGKYKSHIKILQIGLIIITVCSFILLLALYFFNSHAISLFIPTALIYIGTTLIFSNSSAVALSNNNDKSNASAIVSFINMGSTVAVLKILEFVSFNALLLPILFIVMSLITTGFFVALLRKIELESICQV